MSHLLLLLFITITLSKLKYLFYQNRFYYYDDDAHDRDLFYDDVYDDDGDDKLLQINEQML